MFKKHMTPLSKGGALHTHQDKGSSIRPAMDTARGGASNSLQDYAKATPMANGFNEDSIPNDLGDWRKPVTTGEDFIP